MAFNFKEGATTGRRLAVEVAEELAKASAGHLVIKAAEKILKDLL